MPYIISKQGTNYVVRKRGADGQPTGSPLGRHPSAQAARDQIAAITISERKSKKAIGPEGKRLAAGILNAISQLPVSAGGDEKFNAAYGKFRAACQQYSGMFQRIAAGQEGGSFGGDVQVAAAAKRLSIIAQYLQSAGRNEQSARAMAVAIIARQMAGAVSSGKSGKSGRKARTLKAWSKLDVNRMNVIQLKREIIGLRAIQKAARTAINQLNTIHKTLSAANQQLPEDNALGEAMHEIGVALAVLSNERHLTPIIREAETLFQQKQEAENDLNQLQQQQRQPQPPPKRPGLFGNLFGMGKR